MTRQQISKRCPLKPYMNEVEKEMEQRYGEGFCHGNDPYPWTLENLTDEESDFANDVRGLAALRRRARRAIDNYEGAYRDVLNASLQYTTDGAW